MLRRAVAAIRPLIKIKLEKLSSRRGSALQLPRKEIGLIETEYLQCIALRKWSSRTRPITTIHFYEVKQSFET